jgi:tungstate transport system ATP-binding protein
MSSSQVLLKLQALRKYYGSRLILDIDSLELERGRTYLITGSNGAGKTTLLRVLAGLESAELRTFSFDGVPVPTDEISQNLAPRVIYLHQHPYLFNTSVASNIGFGLKARGVSHGRQKQLIKEALAWAGVEHVSHVAPQKLSGGERQRVALARAKVLNPDILLLDEPTANLDEAARLQVVHLIRQMCDNNHCVVIATHDPELIALPGMVKWHLHQAHLTAG